MWRAANEGRTALLEGAGAVDRRDASAARVEFLAAREMFGQAKGKLGSPTAFPLRVIPVASRHAGVVDSLSEIGIRIADAGLVVADAMEALPDQRLLLTAGKIDLAKVKGAHEALEEAIGGLPEIEEALGRMPQGWVLEPFAGPRSQIQEMLPPIIAGIRKAAAALEGLPALLGDAGERRYLIAFSNLSELRGSGGLFGYVTMMRADKGKMELEGESGRPTEIFPEPGDVGLKYPEWFPEDFRTQARIFQNINMSTDFPTVGSFVLKTAETEFGDIDGVIAIDPRGIESILSVTGPVTVKGWPRPIGADNVAEVAMHEVYLAYPKDGAKREAFFEGLVEATFARLFAGAVSLEPDTVGRLDQAAAGGHLRMYSKHRTEQSMFERIGVSGSVSRAGESPDVLSVVSENATGNKIDWFLRREIKYRVRLDPNAGTATSTLETTFRNTSPSSGLPDYVIGSPVEGLGEGASRQIALLIRGPTDQREQLQVDGREVTVIREREVNLPAYRTTVEIAPQGRSVLTSVSTVKNAFYGSADERIFRLHVLPQATAFPDFADIEVEVPQGWVADGQTRYLGDLVSDVVLEVRLKRTVRGNLFETVIIDPFRLVGRIFGALF